VDIQDAPGYAPLTNAPGMIQLAKDAALALGLPFEARDKVGTGSTDMGDISAVMPAIHPYAPGASGTSHGTDYYIDKPELACVGSAEWQFKMLTLLLENNAARAKEIIDGFTPAFPSQKAYFAYIDSLMDTGDRITYTDDGATVRL